MQCCISIFVHIVAANVINLGLSLAVYFPLDSFDKMLSSTSRIRALKPGSTCPIQV